MSRAEERALEAYPTLEQAVFDEMYPRLLFTRNTERSAFVRGYEQAEKDLALTVDDIKKIVNIADAMLDDPKMRIAVQNHSEEEYYQKVLDEYNRLHQTKA